MPISFDIRGRDSLAETEAKFVVVQLVVAMTVVSYDDAVTNGQWSGSLVEVMDVASEVRPECEREFS